MFKWFKPKRGSEDKVRIISKIEDSKDIEDAAKEFARDIEEAEPIPCDFKYIAVIRCGTGFNYKRYEIEVALTTVSGTALKVICEHCGKSVRLYTVEEAMSRPTVRMAKDALYNQKGNSTEGHYVNLQSIAPESKATYESTLQSMVIARNYKVFLNG